MAYRNPKKRGRQYLKQYRGVGTRKAGSFSEECDAIHHGSYNRDSEEHNNNKITEDVGQKDCDMASATTTAAVVTVSSTTEVAEPASV